MSDYKDYEDEYGYEDDALESFGKRKDKRKPKGQQSVKQLGSKERQKKFDDFGLQNLHEMGLVDELISEIKSGKEATVYLVKGPQGYMAAKLYRDAVVRSFKKDLVYKMGRYINKARQKKVMALSGKAGLDTELALWVQHEYDQLWMLHNAGLPVPTPMLGPKTTELAQAGRVVLMELIGNKDEPAPRLSDASLTEKEVEFAYERSLGILIELLRLERVHGDYSAFNLLWHEGDIVMIDFPQMVNIEENPQALEILRQDLQSLCSSFRNMGLDKDPDVLFDYVVKEADVDPMLLAKKRF